MMKNQEIIANDTYTNANDVMKNGILIGCHQGLKKKELNYICKVFKKFVKLKKL